MYLSKLNPGSKSALLLLALLFCKINIYAQSLNDLLSKGKEGSVFVIKENYDLGGRTSTIPKNCSLRFEGGSISNGTLVLNGCFIEGNASFDCTFVGDVANEYFDVSWIKRGNDIGAKINYAQQFFKRLRTPYWNHIFSTPIKIDKATKVYLDGVFTYIGVITNNGSAIEVCNSSSCDIYLMSLSIDWKVLDYSDSRKKNFIGLCLTSCNNCYVYCQSISLFNENIRFQDIYGKGCSYNKVLCLQNNNANIGIRFYADDTYGKSWCNETAVLGGRFAAFNYGIRYGTKYGIVIAGPAFDGVGYKNSKKTNNHDSSSNISVRNASFEGLDIGIYARNVSGLNLWACREEAVKTLVKVSGFIHHFNHQEGYAKGTYDLSEATEFDVRDFNKDDCIEIPVQNYLPYPRSSYGNVFCSDNEVMQDVQTGSYLTSTGVILKTTNSKQFSVGFYDKNSRPLLVGSSAICKYLSKDGKTILNDMSKRTMPNRSAYFAKAQKFWAYSGSINVPDDVDYIFVGLANTGDSNVDHIVVWSLEPIEAITTEKKTFGPLNERPASLPQDMFYFDTTNNRPIYWTGKKWVDANGRDI